MLKMPHHFYFSLHFTTNNCREVWHQSSKQDDLNRLQDGKQLNDQVSKEIQSKKTFIL